VIKLETIGRKGQGVVCGKSAPSRLLPPPVSVKDRLVGPHEQVLNVLIACRCYGPDKPSCWLSIKACLFPHYLIGCCGRDVGYGPMDQTAIEIRIVSGGLLLGGSGSVQIC
jgi:hypothetical protein